MDHLKHANRPSLMDTVFRIFMFLFPYALCVAAYIWVGKKALRVPQPAARIIALAIVAGGLGYTVYRFVKEARKALSNDNFEYIILIVMVVVLAIASIVMAIGEPEDEKRPDSKGLLNGDGQENGNPRPRI